MKRYHVRLEPEADAQLDRIYDYIAAEAGSAIAGGYVQAIADRIAALTTFPARGTPRPDLGSDTRSVNHRGRCTIIYRITGDMVAVLGIFYGGRDIAAAFDRP